MHYFAIMLKRIPLHTQVIVALILGILYALLSITQGWNDFTLDYIDPFGDLFINLLKLIAVPLVLFSIISGVSALRDINKLGKIGGKTLGLYIGTTVVAVTIGLVLVNLIRPGALVSDELREDNRIGYELWKQSDGVGVVLDDLCLICDESMSERVEAKRALMMAEGDDDKVSEKWEQAKQVKNARPLQPLVDVVPDNIISALLKMKMLQVIFFGIFFGIALVMIPEPRSKPVIAFIDGTNEVFVKMVDIVMRAMPFFVFCLMAGAVVSAVGDDLDKFADHMAFLLWYSAVVIFGLAIMMVLFYPGIISMLVRSMSYRKFMKGIGRAQLTAFSTSSSVATLPVTISCVEDGLGVSKRTTSFVLPIGATVNMDGTSLYQGVAVVALAQFHLIDLTLLQQLTIVVTATLASIGSAAVPSAGLIMLILVLESVGLNPAWIAIILPVDRILDMCRTMVNVTGDAAVSTIVANSEGELNVPTS